MEQSCLKTGNTKAEIRKGPIHLAQYLRGEMGKYEPVRCLL